MEKLICDTCHKPFRINRSLVDERLYCPYCGEQVETDLVDLVEEEEDDKDMTEEELMEEKEEEDPDD